MSYIRTRGLKARHNVAPPKKSADLLSKTACQVPAIRLKSHKQPKYSHLSPKNIAAKTAKELCSIF